MKKNKLLISSLIVIAILIGLFSFQSVRYKNVLQKYWISTQNNKAYQAQLDEMKDKTVAFQFSIDQLKYINDKQIQELDSVRKELDIKDSRIKQMGKIKEKVYITDTVRIHDTIFKDKDFCFDTILGDEWYDNQIHLEYPNVISSSVDIVTDQDCFLYVERETIEPPKRWWICRLFQKKHDVYHVTVVEHNPYVEIKENKYIIVNE